MTDQTTAVAAQTPEERIAQDIQKFSPAEAKLARFRDFKTMTINGLADVEGRKMARDNRLEVKRERVELEKLRKGLVDDAVQYQRAVNTAAKFYIDQMEDIEDHLAAEEAKIERLEELERTREAREREKMIEDRKMRLYSLGMAWNGSVFVSIYDATITEQQVATATAEEWTELTDGAERKLANYTLRQQTQAAEEAERKRLSDEEAAKQKAIAEENDRRARDLLAKEQRLNQQLNEARKNELWAAGAVEKFGFMVLRGLSVVIENLHAQSDEEWKATLFEAKEQSSLQGEEERAAERKKLHDNRVKCLKAVGFVEDDGPSLRLVYEVPVPTELGDETGYYQETGDVLIDMPQMEYERRLAIGEAEMDRRNVAKDEKLRKEGEQRERERIAKEQADAELRRVEVAEQEKRDREEAEAKMNDREKLQAYHAALIKVQYPDFDHLSQGESIDKVRRVTHAIDQLIIN